MFALRLQSCTHQIYSFDFEYCFGAFSESEQSLPYSIAFSSLSGGGRIVVSGISPSPFHEITISQPHALFPDPSYLQFTPTMPS